MQAGAYLRSSRTPALSHSLHPSRDGHHRGLPAQGPWLAAHQPTCKSDIIEARGRSQGVCLSESRSSSRSPVAVLVWLDAKLSTPHVPIQWPLASVTWLCRIARQACLLCFC